MKTSGETITGAFSRMTSLNEEAVVAAMRNIYWLAKEDIASLKYNYLYVRENAKYNSPEVVKEMVFAISQCIKNDIQQELQQSPFYRDKYMKIHDCPKLCEFKKPYDEGGYALYNIKDSTSQGSLFNNTRLEFLTNKTVSLSFECF